MLRRMRIIGIMSGTSYDAVEVAVAEFTVDGDDLVLHPLGEATIAYPPDVRAAIAALLPPAATTIGAVCRLHTTLGQVFAGAAVEGQRISGGTAELVVSHGQTVFHWVADGHALGTLQLGAPAWIAARTGRPVLSDVRTPDIARGGQGAPLVPVFDALLLGAAPTPRAALNLGGIANLTVVAPDGGVIGYDVGPAGALLDAAARRYYGEPYDVDGRHAAAGTVHSRLLAGLLAEPYYRQPPPKSTGKELFHAGYVDAAGLAADDVLATLTELTARLVATECDRQGVTEIVAAGGGTRNPVLMARLRALTRAAVTTTDAWGVPSAAKEAYAFALLGWLAWHGLPGALPSVTGARAAAVLGSWTPGARPLRLPEPRATLPRRLRVTTGQM